jgi:hypothetical protein
MSDRDVLMQSTLVVLHITSFENLRNQSIALVGAFVIWRT